MPLYLYHCQNCKESRTVFKPLNLLDNEEPCPSCHAPSQRQICAPAIVADYPGYSCPVTGRWVEGRRAHEENLKRQGCRVLETGETEQAAREGQHAAQQLDKSVDQTVEQFYEALPTEKREQLATAVLSGLDVSVDRK